MNKTIKQFVTYFAGIIVSLFLMLVITHFFVLKDCGVLFFNAFFIAAVSGFLGSLIYLFVDRDKFVYFVVLVSYVLFNALFVYLGPVSMDRSLSSFIYFYSVEKGQTTQNVFSEEYFRPYILRRFEDGVKIGYLRCDGGVCYPTAKTKYTYKFLYPLGKFTGVMKNYDEFKLYMDKR
ncbi:hypothetical protein IKQ21_09160 [bacterium]|nr:hypothetical protein [bacterium]